MLQHTLLLLTVLTIIRRQQLPKQICLFPLRDFEVSMDLHGIFHDMLQSIGRLRPKVIIYMREMFFGMIFIQPAFCILELLRGAIQFIPLKMIKLVSGKRCFHMYEIMLQGTMTFRARPNTCCKAQ